MTTISLKLPATLIARLKVEARNRRKSQSAVIRECLEQGLSEKHSGRKPSFHELAQDLCGSASSGTRDLATNSKYLAGLGK
jgi:plasmid stability protein